MRKGFTLVELLGVILLIAVISLIAFPPIINQIRESKGELNKATLSLIYTGADLYIDANQNDYPKVNDNVYCITLQEIVDSGKLSAPIYDIKTGADVPLDKQVQVNVKNQKYEYSLVDAGSCKNVGIYQETILNGAYPEIGQGMIPVTIENDGTVKKANLNAEWYSYSNKKWANVVTVTSGSRSKYTSAAAGTTIVEADILTYLVWIPRYKYQLWNVNGDSSGIKTSPFEIQIVFENKSTAKSTGTTNGSWLTHPAFTFGEEINGYWVGKFETGYNGAASTAAAQVNSNDSSKVIIKPNTYSWREITVSNMFFTAQGMKNSGNVFGLSTSSDSHMMKNSEWGAVAYLSHSQYGTNRQVRINNNSQFVTGCAASIEYGAAYDACQNAWNTATGYLASTTGNITGIYDMTGGAWDCVMGYTTEASTPYGLSGFTSNNFSIDKYVNEYLTTVQNQYNGGKLGDATKEMGPFSNFKNAWYQDWSTFVSSSSPWFNRGGGYTATTSAGIFTFGNDAGGANVGVSFRVVILGK